MTQDPYSRVEYRRLIAWPQRIEREWPFLDRILATAPSRRVLDLGCGTGEHSRRLAAAGFEAVGVAASESHLLTAADLQRFASGLRQHLLPGAPLILLLLNYDHIFAANEPRPDPDGEIVFLPVEVKHTREVRAIDL